MVNFIKKNAFLSVLIVILLILGSIYLYRFIVKSTTKYEDPNLKNGKYELTEKVYDVNEYSNKIISDDDMARIYLNDYMSAVINDTRASYNLLDEEYKNKRFGNVDNYINYVNTWKRNSKVEKYYKKNSDGYTIYGIYDNYGKFFAFKTKGVMQYSVYLDEDTVEIW